MKLRKTLVCAALTGLLASCALLPGNSDPGPGLWLVPVNHTDRYASVVVVDDTWAGNVGAQGGGGGAVCCIAGRSDWSKPVVVKWEWGYEVNPTTKQVTVPDESHASMVSFPRAPKRLNKSIKEPWTTEDYLADEAYLCVILRSLDKVELAFSSTRGGCKQK